MAKDRNVEFGKEDREHSGGEHGNGNLVQEPGDEVRGRGCFQGEETGDEPTTSTKPAVKDVKPTL